MVFALAAGCTRPLLDAKSQPIVLIVVDTLRADHLNCYGYSRPTSPASCALAGDGVLFERAYTTQTTTTPAIASMLTGLYPHRHGVTQLYFVLPSTMVTLAERLQSRGWSTGAFVSSFVMMRAFSGFDQGFDIYDDDVQTPELDENYERDGTTTVARAVDWLRSHGPRAFLFLHLIEPHGPYRPPSPYRERFALPPGGGDPGEMPDYQRLPELRTVDEYVGRYDAEIAAGDAALAVMIDALRSLGWYDAATIVLVADHGESLGEEGQWFRHGESVNDAEAHVPLIVKFASDTGGAPPPGSRISTPVSVVDIFPTILQAAAAHTDSETAAASDLASIARGGTRAAAPVTELENSGKVTLAGHGNDCTVRWALPAEIGADSSVFAATDSAAWLVAARQLRIDPSGADAQCAQSTARRVSALLTDRFRFRLDVPIVVRQDMRENANRVRYMAERKHNVVPLAAADLEALRQLGYAK